MAEGRGPLASPGLWPYTFVTTLIRVGLDYEQTAERSIVNG